MKQQSRRPFQLLVNTEEAFLRLLRYSQRCGVEAASFSFISQRGGSRDDLHRQSAGELCQLRAEPRRDLLVGDAFDQVR